jgi:hypothetical protein
MDPGVEGRARPGQSPAGHGTERLIRSHSGPVFVLLETPDVAEEAPPFNLGAAEAFGIPFDRASCRPVAGWCWPALSPPYGLALHATVPPMPGSCSSAWRSTRSARPCGAPEIDRAATSSSFRSQSRSQNKPGRADRVGTL